MAKHVSLHRFATPPADGSNIVVYDGYDQSLHYDRVEPLAAAALGTPPVAVTYYLALGDASATGDAGAPYANAILLDGISSTTMASTGLLTITATAANRDAAPYLFFQTASGRHTGIMHLYGVASDGSQVLDEQLSDVVVTGLSETGNDGLALTIVASRVAVSTTPVSVPAASVVADPVLHYTMSLAGIAGGSDDPHHADALTVKSFAFAATASYTAGGGGGGGSGKVTVAPLVVHFADQAGLPTLLTNCASGRHLADLLIAGSTLGDGAYDGAAIHLSDVVVTGVTESANGGFDATLTYSKIALSGRGSASEAWQTTGFSPSGGVTKIAAAGDIPDATSATPDPAPPAGDAVTYYITFGTLAPAGEADAPIAHAFRLTGYDVSATNTYTPAIGGGGGSGKVSFSALDAVLVGGEDVLPLLFGSMAGRQNLGTVIIHGFDAHGAEVYTLSATDAQLVGVEDATGSDGVAVQLATDGLTAAVLVSPIYDQVLTDMDHADTLTGGAGDDTLNGLDGDDFLDGGLGTDRMVGSDGDDTYTVDNIDDTTVEAKDGGYDTVLASVTYQLAGNVEALVLTGDVAINGTGNKLDNVLVGNDASNTLLGRDGNDQLDGGEGADRMIGGTGDDSYFVRYVDNRVIEQANEGHDTVYANIDCVLGKDVEDLVLFGPDAIAGTGNALANHLTGNVAANALDGGVGADVMAGGGGDDRYTVDNAGDVVIETVGNGVDTVEAKISYTLGDNVENLVLIGGATHGTGNALANDISGGVRNDVLAGLDGDDILRGGTGDDMLTGGAGNDNLRGSTGADTLIGGAGRDTLSGGTGADRFTFAAGDLAATKAGTDEIVDFSHADGDLIVLKDIDANTTASGNQAFRLIGSAAFDHHAGELRYEVMTNDGGMDVAYVSGDTNGDGVADFYLRFNDVASFVVSDFKM